MPLDRHTKKVWLSGILYLIGIIGLILFCIIYNDWGDWNDLVEILAPMFLAALIILYFAVVKKVTDFIINGTDNEQ